MSAEVLVYRGSLVENRHRVSLALWGPEGLVAYGGDPGRVA